MDTREQLRHARVPLGIVLFGLVGLSLWLDLPLSVKAAALLIGMGIGAVFPASALCAALAASPFIFDPVAVGSREFSLLELAIVSGGAGIGLRASWEARQFEGRRRLSEALRPLPVSAAAAVLLIAAVLSLFTLADPRYRPESLREFRLVIVEPLLFFGAARWVLTDPGYRRWSAMVLVCVGATVAGIAFGQIVFDSTGVVADGVRRATGPYPHPNNLALFLERVGVFAAALAIGSRAHQRWIALAAMMTLTGAALTFSRGAGVATLLGLAVVLIVYRRKREVGFLVLLAAFGSGALLLTAGDRIIDTGSTGGESTRALIWRAAIDMGLDHPVWGVGLDQFLTQYWPRYVDPAGWPERYTAHAHNLVLDVWLRLGILGLIAMAGLVAVLIQRGRRVVSARHRSDPIALGAVALLLTGMVHGMVDNGFFLPDIAVLTWFAVALIERPDPSFRDARAVDGRAGESD